MIQRHLDRRIAHDEVPAKHVPACAGGDHYSVGISDNCVVLDHVVLICGTGQSNPEIISLRCISISTDPVRTEPVAFRAGQSYASTGGAPVAVSDRDIVIQIVPGTARHQDPRRAVGGGGHRVHRCAGARD